MRCGRLLDFRHAHESPALTIAVDRMVDARRRRRCDALRISRAGSVG
jgi:hypothetical protein